MAEGFRELLLNHVVQVAAPRGCTFKWCRCGRGVSLFIVSKAQRVPRVDVKAENFANVLEEGLKTHLSALIRLMQCHGPFVQAGLGICFVDEKQMFSELKGKDPVPPDTTGDAVSRVEILASGQSFSNDIWHPLHHLGLQKELCTVTTFN
jgi:hypothetical protein